MKLAFLQSLTEAKKISIHYAKDAGVGDLIVLQGEGIDKIARMLGVPDGWKLTKVGNMYAAFNGGDRLTLHTHADDFEADEESADEKPEEKAGKKSKK